MVRLWPPRPDVLMVITSAPTYVATQSALTVLSPEELTTVRFLGSALVLGLYFLLRRDRLLISRRDLPRVILVGLLGYAGYGLLLNLGQASVPAGTTSLLLNISPVFAFLLGFIVLRERTSRSGYLGVLIAIAGVVTITLSGSGATGFNRYALYIVAAALVLAVFLIVQQPLLSRLPPVEVVFWGSLIGGIATLPATGFRFDVGHTTVAFWIAIVVLVVVCTAVAYSFWNVSLARTSVAEGGSLLYVIPLFSVLLGWLLFGEVPGLGSILGGAAALVGVIMLSRAGGSPAPAPAVVLARPEPLP